MNDKYSLLNVSNSYGHDITIKYDHEDTTIEDWLQAFYTAMIGITFNPDTVLDGMIDYVSMLRDTEYVPANRDSDSPWSIPSPATPSWDFGEVTAKGGKVHITDTDSAEFHDLHSLAEEHYK